jgi:very-short-patch-repair endonuclease
LQEFQIGRYSIDFFLPNLNIALEVDGKYWHQNKTRDQKKNQYLADRGLKVVRISDTEIESAPAVVDCVLQRLKEKEEINFHLLQSLLF